MDPDRRTRRVAAFGIGSTNFRYAAARTDGRLLTDILVEPTRPRNLAEQVLSAIDDLRAESPEPIDGVGVTCPGLVDAATGRIRKFDTPDGDTIDRIDLGATVRRETDLPVAVENDCNASALAEWHYGARDGHDCVVHVTIGTGIGGGVVDRGRLVRGETGGAGEFGLLPVAPDSDLESTGVTGAWEAFCSGRGIPEFVARRLAREDAERDLDSELTARDVFRAAAAGDALTRECLEQIDRYNAAGIGAICNWFEPGLVTLGGGVALNNAERLLDGIESQLSEFLFVDRPSIRITPLGDDIGLYGALAAFRGTAVEEPVGPERAVTDGGD